MYFLSRVLKRIYIWQINICEAPLNAHRLNVHTLIQTQIKSNTTQKCMDGSNVDFKFIATVFFVKF